MAGHAQLKFVMTECWKTQILLTRPILQNIEPFNEPRHEKICFMPYANNTGIDQPAHLRSLISAFVVRCLDSIIPLVSISEISSLYLASVAEQTCLSLPTSQTLKTGFLVTRLK